MHPARFCLCVALVLCAFIASPAADSPPSVAADWRPLAVPGAWEGDARPNHDSFAWYRCFVKVPASWAGKDVTLAVEHVENAHEAYVNGARIGGAGRFPPNYQDGLDAANRYVVPTEKLRASEWNLIALRVYGRDGRGGFKGEAPQLGTDKQHIRLKGQWQFRGGDDLSWASILPLTPALSPSAGEREKRIPSLDKPTRPELADKRQPILPLPRRGGEGRGEGAANAQTLTPPPGDIAKFDKIEDGPVPRGSAGHKMASRGHPLPPDEAARSFTVPDDLEIEQVLAEPLVAQPVFLNFDERGRMWVVQYRQYPAPAGLNAVSKDQFWRAVYDKVPEPPPRGPKGLDRITIHEDTDGDGVFDKHKTFVDGLNIATSCVKGRGGVWVLNPPYLLFYPDKNDDDVPDGDPIVHLEGFGLEDTHSVVNSLRWGPDGWLYAAQGSTVTANVRVRADSLSPSDGEREKTTASDNSRAPDSAPRGAAIPPLPRRGGEGRGEGADRVTPPAEPRRSTRPGEPPVYSQGQNIWRYHPEKHIYEIFAEGGGNAFGVEIDPQGRIFSGHNGGDTRGFHYMQGAYLRKGFEKHGELSNPYAFGYFPQMDGTKGERFTHNFILYHGGALPPRYEGKLFGVEPLQGRVVLSEITPDGSTFKTRDLERVVTSSDSWFRPVDIKAGPDGAIYIADWYDRQVTHTRNQEGNIDTSNGRIYRLKKKGAKPMTPSIQDETVKTLVKLFPWVRQAILTLSASDGSDQANPLQYFWAQNAFHHGDLMNPTRPIVPKSPFNADLRLDSLNSSSADVQVWAIRLLGDFGAELPSELKEILNRLASTSTNIEIRAQLACTAKRLHARDGLPIIGNLLTHDEDAKDPRLPLLCWWAIESKCELNREAVLKLFEDSTLWTRSIVEREILARLMRRFAAVGTRRDLLTCAKLLQLSPSREHSVKLMAGFEEAFKGRSLAGLPDELIAAMARHQVGSAALKLRMGDATALAAALSAIADERAPKPRRREFIEVLGEVRPPAALDALLRVADNDRDPDLRKAALSALPGFDDPRIPATVLKDFNAYAAEVRPVALTLLASRAGWSLQLAEAVDAGQIKPAAVPLEVVRQIKRHKGERLTQLVSQHWPQTGNPTTAEMAQRIRRLADVARTGKGNPYAGQKLFNTSCASCHTLFARGGHVGPDLTSYQRGDLDTMLLHVVNPSAEIREGYENFRVETKDDRFLSGFLVERDDQIVVLRGPDGQNITLDRKEITEMRAAGLSLMPEGLLDALDDQQVRDLFAYLRSTQPLAN